jgi:fumarate hydratase class II
MIERSLAMATALSPHIGYDAAAKIAREAYESGKTVREVALEKRVVPEGVLEKILDPWRMTIPSTKSEI